MVTDLSKFILRKVRYHLTLYSILYLDFFSFRYYIIYLLLDTNKINLVIVQLLNKYLIKSGQFISKHLLLDLISQDKKKQIILYRNICLIFIIFCLFP